MKTKTRDSLLTFIFIFLVCTNKWRPTTRAWRCAARQVKIFFREERLKFSIKAATTGRGIAPNPMLVAVAIKSSSLSGAKKLHYLLLIRITEVEICDSKNCLRTEDCH